MGHEKSYTPESDTHIVQSSEESRLKILDELEIIVRDVSGETKRELSMRSDGRKEGSVDIDRTGTRERIQISGQKLESPDNLADENEYAVNFAKALTRKTGTLWTVVRKLEEDSDVPDIWLHTLKGKRGVQITHLDHQTIQCLNRAGHYSSEITIEQIVASVLQAIQRKQNVDPAMAAKTYLLLIAPYPIREVMQRPIRQLIAAAKPNNAYYETWVASLNEPAFQVE